MKEERLPKPELDLYLKTLGDSLAEHTRLHPQIQLFGLPVEEWAGPGYAIGALFDPYVLTAPLKPSTVYLEWPDNELSPSMTETCSSSWRNSERISMQESDAQAALSKHGSCSATGESFSGIKWIEKRVSQKEKITFRVNARRSPELLLPMLWGGVEYQRFEATSDWQIQATVAECPALATRDGAALFAFNPLKVIHRYLNMADPSTTRDLTDLLVKAVLGASGIDRELDDDDLRRDFHALGVSSLLLGQMHKAVGQSWSVEDFAADLRTAAVAYVEGDHDRAREILGGLFARFADSRKRLVPVPVYIMAMPHGGILFENEGYAEYDSPELAARALNLLLDWQERFGFHFAPDIGAGTLEEFAKSYPKTIHRFRAAWEKGAVEFVNGSYAQPYSQLWDLWDQEKQFEIGLKTFDELLGRHPKVYASQEISLHPAMPDLLRKFGFDYAIHRSQNLGLAPIDTAALIEWQSPAGAGVRTLPAHPLRSERRGGEIWRHFPVLLTTDRNKGLPFIALTSLMDQTFVDIYNEEILRANHYACVWGEFVTPSEFFEKTKAITAEPRCYTLDQYYYELDLSGNSIHGHQTGGYSSEQAFMFKESLRLRELDKKGAVVESDLKRLLNQEAHDCYIIPYFATGYFMEGGMTDYNGPRYRSSNDQPRGLNRYIRDTAGYPKTFSDHAPVRPEPCLIQGGMLSSSGKKVEVDLKTGAVVSLAGRKVSLGALKYNGAPFEVQDVRGSDDRLCLSGNLPGFGAVVVEYFLNAGWLYGEVSCPVMDHRWEDTKITWMDAVYLEHSKSAQAGVVRTVSAISQPTGLERFHSLDVLKIREAGSVVQLKHGGNIFFRQTPAAVQNRLWCYDEFCDRFYWAVEIKASICR